MFKSHKSFFNIALFGLAALFCAVEAFAVPVVRKLGTSSTTASSGLTTVKSSSAPNTSTTSGSRIGVVKASGISGASKGLSTVRTAATPARLPVGTSIKSFNTAKISGLSKIKKSTETGEITPQADVDLSGYYTKIEVNDLADQKLNISDLVGDDNYVYVDTQQDGSVVVGLDMDALADYIDAKIGETEQQERGRIQSQVLEDTVTGNLIVQWKYQDEDNWEDFVELELPDVGSLQSTIETLQASVNGDLDSLTTRIESTETRVESLETEKANIADVYNKTEIDQKINSIEIRENGELVYDTRTRDWTYVEIDNDFSPDVLN